MRKKITIVGRGTVGCLSVSHYLKYTDYEIEWSFDPKIQPAPVGEGTTLIFPYILANNLNFSNIDLDNINSTPKLGIWKKGWGNGKEFYHPFLPGSSGLHFNAIEFQNYVFDKLVYHPRIRIVEENLIDYHNVDSDHVMVCTGSPKNVDENYKEHTNIPVNSAIVFQCPWDFPKFLYSITFARKHGWIFGIPLKNRCAIGYVFNKNFSTKNDIETDVQSILEEFDLKPTVTREISFNNYSRKKNFDEKVCYNGNASFFLEPLEATSTHTAILVNRMSIDLWHLKNTSVEDVNQKYVNELDDIESMISLHYFSGSVYKNDFWSFAKKLSEEKLTKKINTKNYFSDIIRNCVLKENFSYDITKLDVGSWSFPSYPVNISGLGISEKLKKIIDTK